MSFNNPSKPHCWIPWGSIAVLPNGNVIPCVATNTDFNDHGILGNLKKQKFKDIWTGEKAKGIRQAHFQNPFRFGPCVLCRNTDKTGGLSRRADMNTKYGEYFDNLNIDYQNTSDPTDIIFLDMAFSSLCNLTCTMCSSTYSTGWIDLDKKLQATGFEHEIKMTDPTGFENYRDNLSSIFPYLKNLNYLFLKGGEPLLNKDVIWFLKNLVERGIAANATLAIISNGTIHNKKIMDLFGAFKKVEYVVSLDAVGDLYRYIRGGEKYSSDDVIAGLREMKLHNRHVWISLAPTVQAYNILRFSELIKASLEVADEVYCKSWVLFPAYQSPISLPEALFPKAVEELEKSIEYLLARDAKNRSVPFLQYMISYMKREIPWIHVPSNRKGYETKMKQYTKFIDGERNMQLGQILPELEGFLAAP